MVTILLNFHSRQLWRSEQQFLSYVALPGNQTSVGDFISQWTPFHSGLQCPKLMLRLPLPLHLSLDAAVFQLHNLPVHFPVSWDEVQHGDYCLEEWQQLTEVMYPNFSYCHQYEKIFQKCLYSSEMKSEDCPPLSSSTQLLLAFRERPLSLMQASFQKPLSCHFPCFLMNIRPSLSFYSSQLQAHP